MNYTQQQRRRRDRIIAGKSRLYGPEEEEPQGESTHPYPNYLVYQVARRVITKHSLTVNGIHNLINFENFTKPGPVNETSLGY